MAQELTVVVTGSTGKQGGAVAQGLLERGHKVRAVTRDPNSSQAKLLAKAGATLVTASLEDTSAITKALDGATSLFAMTIPSGGMDAETRQGVAAADAAKAAGVHLVFTSSAPPTDRRAFRTSTASMRSKSTSPKSASAQRFWRPFPSSRTSISRKSSLLKGFTRRGSRRQGRSEERRVGKEC